MTPPPIAAGIEAELAQYLHARHMHPAAAWLQDFLASMRPNAPLPAIKQTALFRLLAADITTALAPPPSNAFPSDIMRGQTQSRLVAGPIVCQILDVDDIGRSRWSQVEAIEAGERGETTKGREIVRVVEQADDDNENDSQRRNVSAPSRGPLKLLLQDAYGLRLYALDLRGIDGLHFNMAMGAKLLLRNVDVRRGVAMLEPDTTQVLGGKLDALDKAWKQGRKDRLMVAARVGAPATG